MKTQTEHRLIDNTLYVEPDGVIGRCICGWNTGHRFSSMSAAVAFQDHVEETPRTTVWDTDES